MKKFLSVFFSLAFLLSFSMPVSASESADPGILANDDMPSEAEALALWDYLDASRFGDEAVLSDTVSPEFDFERKIGVSYRSGDRNNSL